MRVFMGLYGLRELGHNRVKGRLVVEPMRKEMHAHKRQTGPDADDRCSRDSRSRGGRLTRTSLATIELPLHPPPVELAQADYNRSLPPRGLVKQQPARALRVLLEKATTGPAQCPRAFCRNKTMDLNPHRDYFGPG